MKYLQHFIIIVCLFLIQLNVHSNEIIIRDDVSTSKNLKENVLVFSSKDSIPITEIDTSLFIKPKDSKPFFYFDFDVNTIALKLDLTNQTNKNKEVFIRLSNAMIYEIVGFKLQNKEFLEVYKSGIKHPFNSRSEANRNFIIPISLKPNEKSTYLIHLNKMEGRPLVTHINLHNENELKETSFKEYIILGVYVGFSFIFVIIGICFFIFFKDSLYLFYALYVLFLCLFILSYTGVFQQLILPENQVLNKYLHYVVFSEIAMVLFVVFAQKFLETKKYQAKLYKIVMITVGVAVILRVALHFFMNDLFLKFIPIFMKVWYLLNFLGILLIAYQIVVVYKKSRNKNSLFSIAYFLMILGGFVSILYHSYGVLDAMIFGLPMLMYSSLLEIVLITIALGITVNKILVEKKELIIQIEEQRKQNLATFLMLTNKERIYLDQLKYIKSDGNYLEFYLDERRVMNRNRLKMILEKLPTNFVQVHRSYIINKNYIKATSSTTVTLNPDTEIPVSRKFKANL